MGTSLALAIPVVGLTFLLGWALWHLLNDEKSFPQATATTKDVNLDELIAPAGKPELAELKETPATSLAQMPQAPLPAHPSGLSCYTLSGMGSSWKLSRRLVPRRRRHRMRML